MENKKLWLLKAFHQLQSRFHLSDSFNPEVLECEVELH